MTGNTEHNAPSGETVAARSESQAPDDPSSDPLPESESVAAQDSWWNENVERDQEATRPLNAVYSPADSHIELLSSSDGVARIPVLFAATQRDIGKLRHINQDHVFAMVSTLPREDSDMQVGLFVVADGMGGHEGGEIASQLAVSSIVRMVLAHFLVPALEETFSAALQDLIIEAVQEANRVIWNRAHDLGIDMGTTCTAALVVGRTVYIGHVGDSRAYMYAEGNLRQLTNDHSAVGRLIQLGQLDPSEAREHPLRSQLYRSIGQQEEVHVDFIQCPLATADYLLLCSDGMWGMIDETCMIDVLSSAEHPNAMCQALIDQSNAAGGDDNISVVIVQL